MKLETNHPYEIWKLEKIDNLVYYGTFCGTVDNSSFKYDNLVLITDWGSESVRILTDLDHPFKVMEMHLYINPARAKVKNVSVDDIMNLFSKCIEKNGGNLTYEGITEYFAIFTSE
ncbi:MAG: hypothetical protein WC877_00520 [Dehalococcoidales bacterium]|jgi:hypothetical protein